MGSFYSMRFDKSKTLFGKILIPEVQNEIE